MTAVEDETPEARKGSRTKTQPATKRLLLASGKGGCSKSTLSVHFAVAAAREGRKVALLDLDDQKTVAYWWGERPEGLAEIDCHVSSMTEAVATLDGLSDYDLVIIDTPPTLTFLPGETKKLIRKSDFVLIPSGTGKFDRNSAIEFMKIVQSVGTRSAFCLTMTQRTTKLFDEARGALNDEGPLCPIDVPLYNDLKTITEVGATVFEAAGKRGAEEVGGVWRFVRRELGLK